MSLAILFNKPYGVLCQFTAGDTRSTLADYIPHKDVYAAGRLDADSEGLVLLTSDGRLQHRIADPRHKLPKLYYVQVEGLAGPDALRQLSSGVRIRDYTTRQAHAQAVEEPDWIWPRVPPIRERRHIPTSWLTLELTEGRNRQVRRMTAAVGLPTLRLIRHSIGRHTVAGLHPGEWREIDIAFP